MRESRPYGSVRGARGNSRPYRYFAGSAACKQAAVPAVLLGRDQTSAGRNYPTVTPQNYGIDLSKSGHGVAPGSLPDAIRSLQHSRTVSNLTHYPTIDGSRLRFREWDR